MASTQLNKAVQRVGSDAVTKMTYSVWIKRSGLGEAEIFSAHQLSSYYTDFYFNSSDRLQLYSYINSSGAAELVTQRLFRDTNAWYHIVLVVDTTLSTASDRIKFYINGVRETVFNGGVTYPSQGSSFGQFNDTGATLYIGNNPNRTAFSGSMSYSIYTPYTASDASPFGSTDSTTGEWKINTSPTPTYSTAGFFILKDGNSVTDQSGNGNNFTVGAGTLTNYKDCPSNVFSTMNSLANFETQWALFENNNTYVRSAGTGEAFIASTLGIPPTSGKFYTEVKYTQGGSASNIGISGRMNPTAAGDYVGNKADSYAYRQNGEKKSDDVSSSYGDSYAPGDIIGIAVDATNSKIYFSKNGVWQNSGNPESGATGTGAAFTISTTPTDGFYFMACAKESGSDKNYYAWNFGNGFFQTSAVADNSTATASTPGVFNYAVPTGYQPLSTKGLNA